MVVKKTWKYNSHGKECSTTSRSKNGACISQLETWFWPTPTIISLSVHFLIKHVRCAHKNKLSPSLQIAPK